MLKRTFDIFCAFFGSLALSPVMLIVAAAIRLGSPGPILFRQVRVGLGRREFTLLKFRTMVPEAPKIGAQITAGGDPRITRIGRLLRRTKLDELPQLWNVLRGDMSLVGPRPEVPRIVEKYRAEWARVFEVRPGITDLATLEFRDEERVLREASDVDRAYMEVVLPIKIGKAMEYVERRGFALDLAILFRTVWAITGGRFVGREDQTLADEAIRQIRALEER